MNQIVKNFLDIIKKGDLDAVIQERDKLGLDLV